MDLDADVVIEFPLLSLDVASLTTETVKHAKPEISATRRCYSQTRRRVFAEFVLSRQQGPGSWQCCGETFTQVANVHQHVAATHTHEVEQSTAETIQQQCDCGGSEDEEDEEDGEEGGHKGRKEESTDINALIPDVSDIPEEQLMEAEGEVLLYYWYCKLPCPARVCEWQAELCRRLHLTGKVRVACEGINGTVGGSRVATALYIQATLKHPAFKGMGPEHFKRSAGGSDCFPSLKVGVHQEIVPMGVDPKIISYTHAGGHLDPEEFHREVEKMLTDEETAKHTLLLDCRNFYESKIGQFSHCVAPDIRKFSYFPDYVDQNLPLFTDKRVLMYCTGGIRCERASAYLRSKEVCREVLQLRGGIHKYLERFPDGFYRGKLFVFDERYAIAFNHDVIAVCRYCGQPWDQYQLCRAPVCCQLVLSCVSCREKGYTACCPTCQRKQDTHTHPTHTRTHTHREECECTDTRPRIPQDS